MVITATTWEKSVWETEEWKRDESRFLTTDLHWPFGLHESMEVLFILFKPVWGYLPFAATESILLTRPTLTSLCWPSNLLYSSLFCVSHCCFSSSSSIYLVIEADENWSLSTTKGDILYLWQNPKLICYNKALHWDVMSKEVVQFCSVTQSCPPLCNPVNRSTPGLSVHHQLPKLAQNHVHQVGDAIQPSQSSVIPFSSCPQSFPESGSFQMSQFFSSGGQSIRVSASASVLPMNIQDWFPLGWTGWSGGGVKSI